MEMKKLLLILSVLVFGKVQAQVNLSGGIKQAIESDWNLVGNNYASYFNVYDFIDKLGQTKQTPAPDGYEAFYVSSYHRHGSRWLGSTKQYQDPITLLKRAGQKGVLTEDGKLMIKMLEAQLAISTKENLGQLTDIGAAQHKAMAERMVKNFPEVFDGKGDYFAQSSTVKRCVLSMNSECAVIEAAGNCKVKQVNGLPGMQDRLASFYNTDRTKAMGKIGWSTYANEKAKMTPYKRIMKQLMTDASWLPVKEQKEFVWLVFDIAQNMRSHKLDIDLWKFFTKEEIETFYTVENREWYYTSGPAPLTKGVMPLRARNQLVDILEAADTIASRKNWHGTNLRFGHDTFLMPLSCLMELGTCGQPVQQENIDKLDQVWRMQEISPMGGNIQLVFYRPKNGADGDVLIKAMLNEREVTLPGKAVSGPYYKWTEIRNHWKNRIK